MTYGPATFSEAPFFLPPSPAAPAHISSEMMSVPTKVDDNLARFLLQRARVIDDNDELPAGQVNRRPVSWGLVRRYANDMIDGAWVLTHEDIAVAKDGQIPDGQHRLLAVLEAYRRNPNQKPVPLRICYNADPGTFAVLNTGKTRNTSDVLAISGLDKTTATKVSHAAKLLYCYEATRIGHKQDAGEAAVPYIPNKWARTPVANARIVELVEAHPGLLADVEHTAAAAKNSKLSAGALITARYIIARVNPVSKRKVHDFFEILKTGQDAPYRNHPAFVLRDWSLRRGATNIKVNRQVARIALGPLHLRLCVAMWNHSVNGQTILRPSYSIEGLVPDPLTADPDDDATLQVVAA